MANQELPPQEGNGLTNGAPEGRERGMSRRALVRATLVTGAVVGPMGIVAAVANAQPAGAPALASLSASRVQRRQLERPERAFILSEAQAFVEIQNDENQHVSFLQNALSSSARPKPTFKGLQQSSLSAFVAVSKVLENTGVGAYLMAAPAISSKDNLKAAASIVTIEARHAGYLDALVGTALGPNGAFDKPIAQADIVTAVTPFIASLNGGPDPSGQLSSDTDILNFALLLEFLEAEFYNLNVPQFFGTAGQG